MKVKFVSYWNNRDEEGDIEVQFALTPSIIYQYYQSHYGSTKILYIHWLLWEIEFDFNPSPQK